MKKNHFLLWLWIGCFVWMAGCATTPPKPPEWKPLDIGVLSEPLTLEKSLELVQSADVPAAAWRARLRAAQAELRLAKSIPNPSFNPSWDDLGLRDSGGVHLSNLTYGISFPIFFWWPQAKKIAAAEANRMVEEASIRSDQRQLSLDIGAAYFNLVADQRKIAILENLVGITRENMRLVQKMRQLQSASDFDVARTQSDLLSAESELHDAQNQLRRDQLAFAFALGTDRPFYPKVADCGDQYLHLWTDPSLGKSIPDDRLASALQSDPDLAKAKATTKVAEADWQVEKRSAFPLADLMGNAGPKDAPEGLGAAAGLDIPIPIFNQNQAGIAKAEAALLAAQTDQEKTRRVAIAKLSTAWEEYQAAVEKWDRYSRRILEFERKNQAAAQKFFEAGQISYLESLQARNQYQKALLNEVDTWKEVSTAAWDLSCLLGQRGQTERKSQERSLGREIPQ